MEEKVGTDGCKHTHLCLNVKRDEAVCDQVMDGLKPLLSNKVFSIMVETEVSRLVPKPVGFCKVRGQTGSKTFQPLCILCFSKPLSLAYLE